MIIPVSLGENSYDIVLQKGAIKALGEYIKLKQGAKVLVITDSGVPECYAKTVAKQFQNSYIFTFPQGESSKSFETYKSICEKLLELSFTRSDAVIAVGGGVVGDLSGFVSATYMRGIAFYNIPTTFLSQVDSSIGGKTAINLGEIKNIVGAFYQPKAVIIDPDVLSTLSERQLKNGLAESIKMGITSDEELFSIFESDDYKDKLERIIELSLKIKKAVVEEDEKETGLRKVLNFGHTIGHGIESVFFQKLYHGECVSLGILPMCDESIKERVKAVLEKVGLPTEISYDKEKVFSALCHDKKAESDSLTIVICKKIGSFEFLKIKKDELKDLI